MKKIIYLLLLLLIQFSFSLQATTYRGTLILDNWWPNRGLSGPEIRTMAVKWNMSETTIGVNQTFNVQWYLGDSYVHQDQKYPTHRLMPSIQQLSITKLVIRAAVYAQNEYVTHVFLDLGATPPHGGTWGANITYKLNWAEVFDGMRADSAKQLFEQEIDLREGTVAEIQFGGLHEIEQQIKQLQTEDTFSTTMADANRAFDNKDYVGAIAAYQQALHIQPQNVDAQNRLHSSQYMLRMTEGDGFYEGGDYNSAISKYREAMEIFPNEVVPKERIQRAEGMIAKGEESKELIQSLTAKYNQEVERAAQAKEESMKMAATSFSAEGESCNLEYAKFHECTEQFYLKKKEVAAEEVNFLVYQDAASKVKSDVPNLCIKPSCNRFDDAEGVESADSKKCLKVAQRKYELYKPTKYAGYLDASHKFLDLALGKDDKNASAYVFRAGLSEELMAKMIDLNRALALNPDLEEAKQQKFVTLDAFYTEVYDNIRNGNSDYIHKAVEARLTDELVSYKGKSPEEYAIEYDQAAVLKELLGEKSSNPASRKVDSKAQDLLFVAAAENKPATAALLLQKGANPEFKNAQDETPLLIATQKGSKEVIELFLRKNQNLATSTASILSVVGDDNYALAETFLKSGANVETANRKGDNLLMIALNNGSQDMTELMLQYGADVNVENVARETPLVYAAYQRMDKAISQLVDRSADTQKALNFLSGRDSEASRYLTGQLLDIAIEKNDTKLTKLALEFNDDLPLTLHPSGTSNLLYALGLGKVDICNALLDAPLTVNQELAGGSYLLLEMTRAGATALVRKLIEEKQASFSVFDDKKQSALHLAASKGNREMVSLLISAKHPLEDKERLGNTPLHIALMEGKIDIANQLLDAGANANAVNVRGVQPIHFAVAQRDKELVARLITQHGVDANTRGESGMTPLHYAADQGDMDIAQFLMAQGGDTKAVDDFNRMPKKVAKQKGHKAVAKVLK